MADSSVLNLHNSLRQAKERWAVFLGAGSSYDYGIPTMGEIAEILRGLVRDNKPIHGITEPTLILLKTLCPNNEKTPAKWNIEDLLTRLSQLFDATKDVHDAFAKVSTTVGDSEIPETTIRTAKSKPITVFDLSFLPSETVGTVVATISRMLFQVHFLADRGTTTPTLAVYEEAHNYISRIGRGAYGEARDSVERIAKEGRKFGIGTLVVSQRPSELSETLLSQCNTFLCMRLANTTEKNHVLALLPDSMQMLTDVLPSLPRGQVIAIGQASKMPVRFEVSTIEDKDRVPNSGDPEFGKHWSEKIGQRKEPDIANICNYWIRSEKPKPESIVTDRERDKNETTGNNAVEGKSTHGN